MSPDIILPNESYKLWFYANLFIFLTILGVELINSEYKFKYLLYPSFMGILLSGIIWSTREVRVNRVKSKRDNRLDAVNARASKIILGTLKNK